MVGALWRANPEATWVSNSKKFATEYEQAVPAGAGMPAGGNQLRRSYNNFRREALFQFYKVDSALNALCGEIVAIGRPLNALLGEISDGT